MEKIYLQEAFHAMNLLDEDFSLDTAGIKDIMDFTDQDELEDIVDVYDPEAETEEEIKDSYIGDVILECNVCHTHIFKPVEEVEISEDGESANMEDECPMCHSNDGYKVIGQVAPYQEDPEIKVEIEDKDFDDDIDDEIDMPADDTDIEIEDDFEANDDTDDFEADDETDDFEEVKGKKKSKNKALKEALKRSSDDLGSSEAPVAEEKDLYQLITNDLYSGMRSSTHHVKPTEDGEHTYENDAVIPASDGSSIRVCAPTRDDLKYAIRVAKEYKVPVTQPKALGRYSSGAKSNKFYVDIDWEAGDLSVLKSMPAISAKKSKKKKGELTESNDAAMDSLKRALKRSLWDTKNGLPREREINTINLYIDSSGSSQSYHSEGLINAIQDMAERLGKVRTYFFGQIVGKNPNSVGGGTNPQAVIDHIQETQADVAIVVTDEDFEVSREEVKQNHIIIYDASRQAFLTESNNVRAKLAKAWAKYGDKSMAELDETVDLSDRSGSVTSALIQIKDKITNATSKNEIVNAVQEALGNMTAPGAKKVLAALTAKKSVTDMQFYLFNVMLKGAGEGVIKEAQNKNCSLREGFEKVDLEIDDIATLDNIKHADEKEAIFMDFDYNGKHYEFFPYYHNGTIHNDYEMLSDKEESQLIPQLKSIWNSKFAKVANNSLREGFEKVDLEMEDKIIHVSEEEKEPIPDAEMITPVSDDLEAELLNDDEESSEPTVPEEEPIEVEDDEEPTEEPAEDEEDIDYDVDDFDENSFDELSESYLKKVYENVNSFKTTAISQNNNKLVVEGKIKFNSGKEKPTKFIFEAKDATKNGQLRFIGENAQITRGKKSFTLTGNMKNNKFMAESLNYNYRVKSNRVYGTIKH